MTKLTATTESDAKTEAIGISETNKGQYVTVTDCFSLFASVSKRLHVNSPGDSTFGWYVLNGQVKQFTDNQRIADQKATPQMS